jgi:predicted dehydrogenase
VTLIGCGAHGADVLLPSLHAAGAHVVGVHDADVDRARKVADRWHVPRVFRGVDEAIESADAVVCALPGPEHFNVVDHALRANRFVFVEKPPGVSLREVEALAGREETSRARCIVGLNFRFAEGVVRLRRLLDHGQHGPVDRVRVSQLASKPRGSLWGEDSPAHSLFFAQGIHAIDLVHVLLGEAELTAARRLPVGAGVAIEASLQGAHGALGDVIFGSSASAFTHLVEVVMASGARVSLTDLSELATATAARDGSERDRCVLWRRSPLSTGYGHAGYQGELDAFARILAGQTNDGAPSLRDAARTFRTFNAMLARLDEPTL